MALPIDRLASIASRARGDALMVAAFGLLVGLVSRRNGVACLRHVAAAEPRPVLSLCRADPCRHAVGARRPARADRAHRHAALRSADRRPARGQARPAASRASASASARRSASRSSIISCSCPRCSSCGCSLASARRWRPLRPETLAIAGVGVAYAAALIIEHDYLTRIVPLVRLAYGQFGPHSLRLPVQPLSHPRRSGSLASSSLLTARILLGRSASLAAALFVAAHRIRAPAISSSSRAGPITRMPVARLRFARACGTAGRDRLAAAPFRIVAPALLVLPLVASAQRGDTSDASQPGRAGGASSGLHRGR